MGFKGLCLESSWMGQWFDAENVYPYSEFAEANDYPIVTHPPQLPFGFQIMNKYRLEETVGRPAETAVSAARMISSGRLDRYPDVQIVLVHIGGAIMPIPGRLDFAHRLGNEGLPVNQHARNKLRPSEYIRRNFHADTMGFNVPMLAAVVNVFSSDRRLFGSDYGPVPISPREHIDVVNRLDLNAAQHEDILWCNANRMFHLSLDIAGKRPSEPRAGSIPSHQRTLSSTLRQHLAFQSGRPMVTFDARCQVCLLAREKRRYVALLLAGMRK